MPGTRLFFLICAALAVTLLGLSVFASSPPDPVMTADANAGFAVWKANGCENCHTLYGQGGAYAPDLTTIYGQRGETYLYEFLLNPATLHPGLRVMPSLSLTRTESAQVIALLAWASERSSEAGFPANPINVRGGVVSIVGLLPEPPSDSEGGSAVDNGRIWFTRAPGNCSTCHSIEPDVTIVGPSLFGIGDRAGSRISGITAEEYIRQSIINPGAYVVEGFPDAMARNLGDALNSQQIDEIIAFLLTLEPQS